MKEEVKKLIEKVSKDPELKKKFKNIKTEDEFLSFAKENGFNVTKDELNFGKNELENGSKLSNDELEKVVGGLCDGICLCAMRGNGSIPIYDQAHGGNAECTCITSGVGVDPMNPGMCYCECQMSGSGGGL